MTSRAHNNRNQAPQTSLQPLVHNDMRKQKHASRGRQQQHQTSHHHQHQHQHHHGRGHPPSRAQEYNGSVESSRSDFETLFHYGHKKRRLNRKKVFGVGAILLMVFLAIVLIVIFTVIVDLSNNGGNAHRFENKFLFVSHPSAKIYSMDENLTATDDQLTAYNHTRIESFCVDVNRNVFVYVGNADEVYNQCLEEIPLHIRASAEFQLDADDNAYFQHLRLNPRHSVVPGLIDAHAHIMSLGRNLNNADLSGATSMPDLRDLLEDYIEARDLPPDTWVVGWGWLESAWTDWAENAYPTRWDLDASALLRNYSLYLTRIDGTSALANTHALDAIGGLPAVDPEGGEIIRRTERAENGSVIGVTPTGMLVGTPAIILVSARIPAPSLATQHSMLRSVLEECAANGLTGIHDAGNGASYVQLYRDVIDGRGFANDGGDDEDTDEYDSLEEDTDTDADADDPPFNFTLRINAFADASMDDPEDYRLMFFYKQLLTVQSVKHYMDGSLGPWGASLLEPYCDRPNATGVIRWHNASEYYRNISAWHRAGFQICTHAIGDNANRLVIDAYERLIAEFNLTGTDHRLRIEHAQILNISHDLPRVERLRILLSMQPAHCTSDMVFAPQRLNCTEYGHAQRLTGAYAWQTILDTNITVLPFGSDFPAVGIVNPFYGIYAAYTRANETGYPRGGFPVSSNKVSLFQALKGYTIDAAYAGFQERYLGSISKNKFADFILLDRDLFEVAEVEPTQILATNVVKTYLGGNIVYRNQNFA